MNKKVEYMSKIPFVKVNKPKSINEIIVKDYEEIKPSK